MSGTRQDAGGRRRWYRQLYVWVLVAMVAGAVTGLMSPALGQALEPLGDGFVNLITMMLGPVVFCMVVTGIASVRSMRQVGATAGKSLLYFEIVTTAALVLGLVAVNLVRPGAEVNADPSSLRIDESVREGIAAGQELHWWDYLLQAIPSNAVQAFADGAILQVLVVAVLFGVALVILGPRGARVTEGVARLGEVLFGVVRIVTYAAPVGVFGAMAYTTGHYGAATLDALLTLIATFYGTAIVFCVVVLGGIVAFLRIRPLLALRYFKDEVLLALGASSSEVALPGIVRKLENLGVSKSTAGISVSAGYSFNLDGTCIYLTLSSVFIAQAFGIELSLGQQAGMLAVMLLTSKGTAGVTGGGFVMLATSLSSLSLIPVAGIMLVFGIDRFMSECRAVVNSLGNAVAGLVVARWQREIDPRTVNATMAGRRTGLAGTEPAPAEPDGAVSARGEVAAGTSSAQVSR